jgi:hypothetical protein
LEKFEQRICRASFGETTRDEAGVSRQPQISSNLGINGQQALNHVRSMGEMVLVTNPNGMSGGP